VFVVNYLLLPDDSELIHARVILYKPSFPDGLELPSFARRT
jgi:hypothetical protein